MQTPYLWLNKKIVRSPIFRLQFYNIPGTRESSEALCWGGTEKSQRPPKTVRNHKDLNVKVVKLETEIICTGRRDSQTETQRGE